MRRRLLFRSTLATCRTAELGFFGDIVVIFVTIPFACGHLLRMGVREKVGCAYLRLDFRKGRLRRVDCKHVAIFNCALVKLQVLVTKYLTSTLM